MEKTKALMDSVSWLNNNTPNGMVVDADTILADLVEQADMHLTGLAQDIFNIWEQSTDKKAVERMFYEFTEVEFSTFLEKCVNEITRDSNIKNPFEQGVDKQANRVSSSLNHMIHANEEQQIKAQTKNALNHTTDMMDQNQKNLEDLIAHSKDPMQSYLDASKNGIQDMVGIAKKSMESVREDSNEQPKTEKRKLPFEAIVKGANAAVRASKAVASIGKKGPDKSNDLSL